MRKVKLAVLATAIALAAASFTLMTSVNVYAAGEEDASTEDANETLELSEENFPDENFRNI